MKKTIIWIIGIIVTLVLIAGLVLLLSWPMITSPVNSNPNTQISMVQTSTTADAGQNTNSNQNKNTITMPENYNVVIEGYQFSLSTMTIGVGDSITWTNMDTVAHTVTSDSGTELSSAKLERGEKYSHIFNTPGTYKYHCAPHPSMKGTIIVQ
jgi:plastocyanin